MKVIKIDLPSELESIELHVFADEHIGDKNSDMKRLLERIEYVKNNIHSHTHLPMVMKQAYHRIDPRNSAVALVDKLFVNTAANLNYGGYGEAQEFKPSSKETPVIYLCGTKKKFTAKL